MMHILAITTMTVFYFIGFVRWLQYFLFYGGSNLVSLLLAAIWPVCQVTAMICGLLR